METKSPWKIRRGGVGLLLILAAAVITAGLYLSRYGPLTAPAPQSALDRRCASARTEASCRSLRLYRQTTYDAGACGWEAGACRFVQGDGG
jgi:hypothetical protein